MERFGCLKVAKNSYFEVSHSFKFDVSAQEQRVKQNWTYTDGSMEQHPPTIHSDMEPQTPRYAAP